jgi:hypothetical protein
VQVKEFIYDPIKEEQPVQTTIPIEVENFKRPSDLPVEMDLIQFFSFILESMKKGGFNFWKIVLISFIEEDNPQLLQVESSCNKLFDLIREKKVPKKVRFYSFQSNVEDHQETSDYQDSTAISKV